MPHRRNAGRPIVVRRVARSRPVPGRSAANVPSSRQGSALGKVAAASPALEAARRVGESLLVALVTSTGLYLVGSVYTDAYYGRLSIEVTSLDLAPTYVALQSIHALWGLLEYPANLLLFYLLYRTFASPERRLRGWFGRARERFPRLLAVLANLALVAPLLLDAFGAGVADVREQVLPHRSVLTEVTSVLGTAGLVLLAYVVWLGWSQRRFLLSEVRARRPVPIALVFVVYLLGALASTATVAELAATELLTGASDASLRVEFVTKPGALPELAGKELILVTARGGAYYAVEREPSPPSGRPTSYVVPFAAVDAARVQRLADADATPAGVVVDEAESPGETVARTALDRNGTPPRRVGR
jgi:hypothetical protein